jgi:hypothetical protein
MGSLEGERHEETKGPWSPLRIAEWKWNLGSEVRSILADLVEQSSSHSKVFALQPVAKPLQSLTSELAPNPCCLCFATWYEPWFAGEHHLLLLLSFWFRLWPMTKLCPWLNSTQAPLNTLSTLVRCAPLTLPRIPLSQLRNNILLLPHLPHLSPSPKHTSSSWPYFSKTSARSVWQADKPTSDAFS